VEQKLVENIDIENIRNFSVIAHVDHGKSTLSDAILSRTGNITEADRKKGQVLDTLKVERERGITVKANTASMLYHYKGKPHLLNLIDTPGHIDFSYEVSRSLASCQGALLLVDATQSVQAQTIANFQKAKKLGLSIIPVVTKIDLPNAQPEETALAMGTTFGVDPEEVIMTSAKAGIGIDELLPAIVERLPAPKSMFKDSNGPFYGRIVDSWFDEHRGVVCLVQVVGGRINEGNKISMYASAILGETNDGDEFKKFEFSVQEVGLLTPQSLRTGELRTGQVGYVIAGLRSTRQARIGDTMFVPEEWQKLQNSGSKLKLTPLEGYEKAKPMLFASIYPVDSTEVDELFASVDRLLLNDSSISVQREQSASLGSGLRCGFLGFLHMEVFNQRLRDEFHMETVMTTPSVPYKIRYLNEIDKVTGLPREEFVSNVALFPDESRHTEFEIHEPMVKVTMVTPTDYYGNMVDIIKDRRGENILTSHLDDGQILIESEIPWQEVVCDMHDAVKHSSAGFASFNYEDIGYRVGNLVKVQIVVNGDPCDALSFISHRSKSEDSGRKLAVKLKEVLKRQQFEIVIQAKIGGKVLARERIAPYRKDVLSRSGKTVGGGDITRKKKLLEKQKEGKKRAKMIGKVEIDQEAFWAVLQR
jgi:GTP-binding protein LepA